MRKMGRGKKLNINTRGEIVANMLEIHASNKEDEKELSLLPHLIPFSKPKLLYWSDSSTYCA